MPEFFLEDSSVPPHRRDVRCTGREERLSHCGTGRDGESGSGQSGSGGDDDDDDDNDDCDNVFIRCDGEY